MENVVGVEEARRTLGRLIRRIVETGEQVIITRRAREKEAGFPPGSLTTPCVRFGPVEADRDGYQCYRLGDRLEWAALSAVGSLFKG